jgi:hypothetical protein
MRVDQIPQDESILEGHQRACYARDENGRYVIATSRGWEVERVANQQAVGEVNARITATLEDVRVGKLSVLAYHMAKYHMDASLVAAHTGLWSFRVKRHLRPQVFSRLPESVLQRYADLFGTDVTTLRRVPD